MSTHTVCKTEELPEGAMRLVEADGIKVGVFNAAGDLFASGTVSGARPGTEGSLIELTHAGSRPLTLPDGTCRTYLRDGDRVELRGWAGREPGPRIGLGSVSGTIVASGTQPNDAAERRGGS